MAYSRSACLAWLASGGLSPEEQKQLLTFEPDPGALLAKWQSYVESENVFHLPDKMIKVLNHNANDRYLDNCEGVLQKHGIKAITFGFRISGKASTSSRRAFRFIFSWSSFCPQRAYSFNDWQQKCFL